MIVDSGRTKLAEVGQLRLGFVGALAQRDDERSLSSLL